MQFYHKIKGKLPQYTIILILILSPFYFYARSIPVTKNNPTDFEKNEFRIAHRCGRMILPENTLYACKEIFNNSLADILEMDVHLTKDNHLVVIHDDTVDRTTNGKGKVADLNYEEIKKLDAAFYFTPDEKIFPLRNKGIQILELEEFFKALSIAKYYIEVKVKDPLASQKLIELIQTYNLEEKVFIGSVNDSVNENLKTKAKGKIKVFSGLKTTGAWYVAYLIGTRGLVQPPEIMAIPNIPKIMPVNENFMKAIQEQNIKLHMFTINDKEEIQKFLILGVHGVMTDNPYLFLENRK